VSGLALEVSMSVRAKFYVRAIETYSHPPQSGMVKLSAVMGTTDDNKSWSKYTPSGSIEMMIDNPPAFHQFHAGDEFYVDFTPVKQEQEQV
jgi:hypothetical protein